MAMLVDSEHNDWELEFQNSTDGSGTNVIELGGEAEDSSNRYFDFFNLGGIYFSTACYVKATHSGATFYFWIDGTPSTSASLLVQDLFTETSDTALASHTPNIDAVGNGWGASAGTWTVSGANDRVETGATTAAAAIDSGQTAVDVEADFIFDATTDDAGLVVRYQNISNFMLAFLDNTNNAVHIYKRDGGTFTSLASTAMALGAGTYNLRVTVDASNNYEVFVDDVSKVTVTDATHSTQTSVGIYNSNDGNLAIDNFQCQPF
jgi:hypothetical protein